MLVLNLKVNSDKLINDIAGKDNSSEIAPKPAVYGSINRPILKAANVETVSPGINDTSFFNSISSILSALIKPLSLSIKSISAPSSIK